MSDLSGSERRKLEKLLGMGGGYVLNFSDRTFGDFFDDYRVEIDAEQYKARGTSKANRMRTFWDVDGNYVVGRVIGGMIEYATDEQCFGVSKPWIPLCLNHELKTISPKSPTHRSSVAASM